MTFKYRSIELAELPVEELEQKQLVGIAPLLLLTKGGKTREVLERAITQGRGAGYSALASPPGV